VYRSCSLKIYRKSKDTDVKAAIMECLRNAPHRHGGLKYKVIKFSIMFHNAVVVSSTIRLMMYSALEV
jgi:hypothetical protein